MIEGNLRQLLPARSREKKKQHPKTSSEMCVQGGLRLHHPSSVTDSLRVGGVVTVTHS